MCSMKSFGCCFYIGEDGFVHFRIRSERQRLRQQWPNINFHLILDFQLKFITSNKFAAESFSCVLGDAERATSGLSLGTGELRFQQTRRYKNIHLASVISTCLFQNSSFNHIEFHCLHWIHFEMLSLSKNISVWLFVHFENIICWLHLEILKFCCNYNETT